MLSNTLKIMCVLLFSVALLAQTGCGLCGTAKGCAVTTTKAPCDTPRATCAKEYGEITASLPPNAKPGECYAKVWVPPTFKTVTERVVVRDASETIEIIPARYEWVEEKVLVKDASTQLVVVDAQFASRERTLEVSPGWTDWEINEDPTCVNPKEEPARDIFCLVSHAPARETVQMQAQVSAASVKEVCIPAQYETVRRQKLVSAATTRKVCNPAEYRDIEKTQKVCDGRMAWKLIDCDEPGFKTASINANRAPADATISTKVVSRP